LTHGVQSLTYKRGEEQNCCTMKLERNLLTKDGSNRYSGLGHRYTIPRYMTYMSRRPYRRKPITAGHTTSTLSTVQPRTGTGCRYVKITTRRNLLTYGCGFSSRKITLPAAEPLTSDSSRALAKRPEPAEPANAPNTSGQTVRRLL